MTSLKFWLFIYLWAISLLLSLLLTLAPINQIHDLHARSDAGEMIRSNQLRSDTNIPFVDIYRVSSTIYHDISLTDARPWIEIESPNSLVTLLLEFEISGYAHFDSRSYRFNNVTHALPTSDYVGHLFGLVNAKYVLLTVAELSNGWFVTLPSGVHSIMIVYVIYGEEGITFDYDQLTIYINHPITELTKEMVNITKRLIKPSEWNDMPFPMVMWDENSTAWMQNSSTIYHPSSLFHPTIELSESSIPSIEISSKNWGTNTSQSSSTKINESISGITLINDGLTLTELAEGQNSLVVSGRYEDDLLEINLQIIELIPAGFWHASIPNFQSLLPNGFPDFQGIFVGRDLIGEETFYAGSFDFLFSLDQVGFQIVATTWITEVPNVRIVAVASLTVLLVMMVRFVIISLNSFYRSRLSAQKHLEEQR